MFPFLCDGRDLVILEHFIFESLKIGDVLLYRYKESYLLHRFIFAKNGMLYLRGDANHTNHYEVIKKGDVLGIMVGVKRNGHDILCSSWWWRFFTLIWVETHRWRVCLYHFYRYSRNLKYKLK